MLAKLKLQATTLEQFINGDSSWLAEIDALRLSRTLSLMRQAEAAYMRTPQRRPAAGVLRPATTSSSTPSTR